MSSLLKAFIRRDLYLLCSWHSPLGNVCRTTGRSTSSVWSAPMSSMPAVAPSVQQKPQPRSVTKPSRHLLDAVFGSFNLNAFVVRISPSCWSKSACPVRCARSSGRSRAAEASWAHGRSPLATRHRISALKRGLLWQYCWLLAWLVRSSLEDWLSCFMVVSC